MKCLIFCFAAGMSMIGCSVAAQTGANNSNAVRWSNANFNAATALPSNSWKPANAAYPANVTSENNYSRGPFASQQRRYEVCGRAVDWCDTDVTFWESHDLKIRIKGQQKMWDVYKSKPFYVVVLKRKKAVVSDHIDDDKCLEGYFDNAEIGQVQLYFTENKVFANNDGCHPAPMVRYSYFLDGNFMAVYAGKTRSEANPLLRRAKAKAEYRDAHIAQMHVELCSGCH